MQRFFLPPDLITETSVSFPEEISHQLRHVLRMQPGDPVIVLDNQGSEYDVVLLAPFGKQITAQVTGKRPAPGEPAVQLTLLLCLSQREKFEWMLQKCTELGAAGFLPVVSSRSLVQSGKDFTKKLARWQRILTEAAEQSGRGRVPALHPPLKFEDALRFAGDIPGLRVIPDVQEHSRSLRRALEAAPENSPSRQVVALIGPEGGFTAEEVARAVQAGFVPVTLGPRVLRMETAAMAVSALVMYQYGQME